MLPVEALACKIHLCNICMDSTKIGEIVDALHWYGHALTNDFNGTMSMADRFKAQEKARKNLYKLIYPSEPPSSIE